MSKISINLNDNNINENNLKNLEKTDNNNNNIKFNNGRWSEEEHKKFIEGILEYGNEWKNVQNVIKTRSSTQARSHAQKFFLKIKKNLDINNSNRDKNYSLKKIFEILTGEIKNKNLNLEQKEKIKNFILKINNNFEENNNKNNHNNKYNKNLINNNNNNINNQILNENENYKKLNNNQIELNENFNEKYKNNKNIFKIQKDN